MSRCVHAAYSYGYLLLAYWLAASCSCSGLGHSRSADPADRAPASAPATSGTLEPEPPMTSGSSEHRAEPETQRHSLEGPFAVWVERIPVSNNGDVAWMAPHQCGFRTSVSCGRAIFLAGDEGIVRIDTSRGGGGAEILPVPWTSGVSAMSCFAVDGHELVVGVMSGAAWKTDVERTGAASTWTRVAGTSDQPISSIGRMSGGSRYVASVDRVLVEQTDGIWRRAARWRGMWDSGFRTREDDTRNVCRARALLASGARCVLMRRQSGCVCAAYNVSDRDEMLDAEVVLSHPSDGGIVTTSGEPGDVDMRAAAVSDSDDRVFAIVVHGRMFVISGNRRVEVRVPGAVFGQYVPEEDEEDESGTGVLGVEPLPRGEFLAFTCSGIFRVYKGIRTR